MTIDREPWKQELLSHEELFSRFYDKLQKNFSLCANCCSLHCGAHLSIGATT